MFTLRSAWLVLVLICTTSAGAQPVVSSCELPRYRMAPTGGSTVSVPPADFTLPKVACLGRTLRMKAGPAFPAGGILVFDSESAAAAFDLSGERVSGTSSYSHLRATYAWSPTGESLKIHLRGYGHGDKYDNVVDLTSKEYRCADSVANRCLLAIDQMPDPESSPTLRLNGSLTIAGRIGRDGRISGTRVVMNDVESTLQRTKLENAVRNHLRTWWIEPSTRVDQVSISYYSGGALERAAIGTELALDLPDQIAIRASALQTRR